MTDTLTYIGWGKKTRQNSYLIYKMKHGYLYVHLGVFSSGCESLNSGNSNLFTDFIAIEVSMFLKLLLCSHSLTWSQSWLTKNLFTQLMSLLAVNIKRLIWNRLRKPRRSFGNEIPLLPIWISHSGLVRPELILSTNSQRNMQIRYHLTFFVTYLFPMPILFRHID